MDQLLEFIKKDNDTILDLVKRLMERIDRLESLIKAESITITGFAGNITTSTVVVEGDADIVAQNGTITIDGDVDEVTGGDITIEGDVEEVSGSDINIEGDVDEVNS